MCCCITGCMINQYVSRKIVNMHINVNLIATRKYHVFVQPLIDSISKYFLLRHEITVNVFTDNTHILYTGDQRVKIVYHEIPSYGFPDATLLRYRIMSSIEYDCDYIVYLDVDYLIVSEVGENILGPLVAVLHPGFSVVGGGSWSTDEKSLAYVAPEKRVKYICGGTQSGSKEDFSTMMTVLAERIDGDTSRGVKAEWNDEAHVNWYFSEYPEAFKVLDSSYCMPDKEELAKLWKIDHLPKRILALSKNHSEFQQP